MEDLEDHEHKSLVDGSSKDRFRVGEWRDLPWLILFIIHLVAIGVVAGIYLPRLFWDQIDDSTDDKHKLTKGEERRVIITITIICVAASIVAAALLVLLQRFVGAIIRFGMILTVCMLIVCTVIAFATHQIFLGVLLIICTAGSVLYYFLVRNRIPLAEAMLEASMAAVNAEFGVVYINFGLLVVDVLWIVFWSLTMLALATTADGEKKQLNGFVFFLMALSLYWTLQVLHNIGHVTTSGAVATWWLQPGRDDAVSGSFQRAVSWSLGSICLGSLIIAFIQAVRAIVHEMRRAAQSSDNALLACVACILECLLSCIESVAKYFNKYAYTRVAIYGESFCTAAGHTMEFFKSRGMTTLINDDLTGLALFFAALTTAAAAALVGGIVGLIFGLKSQLVLAMALTGFIIGLMIGFFVMIVLESAVATTFVLWAEDPQTMTTTRHHYTTKIADGSRRVYNHTFAF